MKQISNKETALLGLLSQEPMHAYKIEQEIQSQSMRDWTEISMSSVYKLLKKLEKDGYITSEDIKTDKNILQKKYSITASGKKILRETIMKFISEPEYMKYRIDLATSRLFVLENSEIKTGFSAYRKKIKEAIECYEKLEAYLLEHNCPKHSLALARRPQHILRGELEWVDEFIKGY